VFEIALTACLLAAPDRCKEVSLHQTREQILPFQCSRIGMVEAQKWIENNPGYTVKGLTCRRQRFES
jgi:hypothetical protein